MAARAVNAADVFACQDGGAQLVPQHRDQTGAKVLERARVPRVAVGEPGRDVLIDAELLVIVGERIAGEVEGLDARIDRDRRGILVGAVGQPGFGRAGRDP